MEDNNQNPEVKVSGKKPFKKAKIFCISAIIVVVAAVAAGLALYFTGHLNLTKQDKVWNGINKVSETFTKPIDEIGKTQETKIADKLGDGALELSTEVSADIEEINIESLSSSDKKVLDSVIDLINDSKISLNAGIDFEENEYTGKVTAEVDDVVDSISGEVVYSDDTLSFRSEEINDKFISITQDDIEENLSEYKTSFEQMKPVLEGLLKNIDKLKLTEKEKDHFKKTYKKAIEKEIKKMKIKASSGTVEVNGKSKNCTKAVVEIDDEGVQNLVKALIDAYKNDKEGKKIIREKVSVIAESLGQDIDDDEIDEYIDEYIDKLEDEIDNIKFDGTIKITSYATLTQIYRVDIVFSTEQFDIALETTFEKKKAVTDIKIKSGSQSMNIGTLEVINEKNKKEFKFTLDETIGDMANVQAEALVRFENKDKKYTTTLEFNGEYNGVEANIELVEEENRKTDSSDKLESEDTLTFDVDVPNYITAKGSITFDTSLEVVDSIDVPTVKDSVDINDKTGLNEYGKEAEKNLEKIAEKIKNSKKVNALVDMLR